MNLSVSDRELLNQIVSLSRRGENSKVVDLVQQRLSGLCHVSRLREIEGKIENKQYEKALDDLDLCREFNPNDEELFKLQNIALSYVLCE